MRLGSEDLLSRFRSRHTRWWSSEESRVRRELLHRLSLGDMPYSKLEEALPAAQRGAKSPLVERVLGTIAGTQPWLSQTSQTSQPSQPSAPYADYERSAESMSPARYRLKPELWNEFDPLFEHYNSVSKPATADCRAVLAVM